MNFVVCMFNDKKMSNDVLSTKTPFGLDKFYALKLDSQYLEDLQIKNA